MGLGMERGKVMETALVREKVTLLVREKVTLLVREMVMETALVRETATATAMAMHRRKSYLPTVP
jgi:hypothetical protein